VLPQRSIAAPICTLTSTDPPPRSLVANIIAGEAVAPLRRTAVFGMFQGATMLGQGIGYLSMSPSHVLVCGAGCTNPMDIGGGMIGDTWGIRRPFEVAFYSFLLSTLYVRVAMPYIPAEALSGGDSKQSKGLAGFFAPLRVLIPQRLVLESGRLQKHYGVLFLCTGVFLGVVSSISPSMAETVSA